MLAKGINMGNHDKIKYIGDDRRFRGTKIQLDDNDGGGGDMSNYVTHKELELTKESIERKIETISSELKHEISESRHSMEKMMSIQEKNRRNDRTVTIRWVVGTGIAVISLALAALRLFL